MPADETFFAIGEKAGEAVLQLEPVADENGTGLALRALLAVYFLRLTTVGRLRHAARAAEP